MESNYLFIKKYYISKQAEKRRMFLQCFYIAINSSLLDKNRTQDKVKYHIQHERSWLRRIVMKQVNYK